MYSCSSADERVGGAALAIASWLSERVRENDGVIRRDRHADTAAEDRRHGERSLAPVSCYNSVLL